MKTYLPLCMLEGMEIVFGLALLFAIGVFYLLYRRADARRRSTLTPEQKRRESEETAQRLREW